MRGIINKKRKDFLEITLLIILLFLYAYYETKHKPSPQNHILPTVSTPTALPHSPSVSISQYE